jgi:hypothetical protein
MSKIIYQSYNNEKNTIPRCNAQTAVEMTFDDEVSTRIFISTAGAPPDPPAPTSFMKEGDYIICLAQNYVGKIVRVASDTEIEVAEPHGLTAVDQAVHLIRFGGVPSDVSWTNGAGGTCVVGGVTFPAEFSDGGAGFRTDPSPIIADFTGTTGIAKLML